MGAGSQDSWVLSSSRQHRGPNPGLVGDDWGSPLHSCGVGVSLEIPGLRPLPALGPAGSRRPLVAGVCVCVCVWGLTLSCLPPPQPSRSLRRVHTFGKRENSIKRDPNAPVVIRGWLCKQDSSGLKLWKRRWFVLADYCLFYYRDSREEAVLGSIPLPSYEIRPLPGEGKSRRFTFKVNTRTPGFYSPHPPPSVPQAEHRGMRTYHFSADTQEDMNGWIRAMSQSAAAESDPSTM
uniref:PH domain-containing protein n=1 Tax=Chrysemys picta bellii TaxID=8478 RepID=A0A8C3HNI7_CHRPI